MAPSYAPAPMQGDGTGGVIPFKNPNALASYYIGLFSLLPVASYVMGPAAIFLGVKGLKYAKQYPIVKGQAHAWVGIICGGLWTLVYYGFTLLMIIAMVLRSTR
ncbi:MAG: hypothetical protein EOO38_19700 [Cytophagaceae bacterium]|nr:MAG: hypothetical protein EOO38_19700 [Cytophagaceae bacterium]